MIRRLLLAGAGTGAVAPTSFDAWYNGQTGANDYRIGYASSTDGGATWTKSGLNPILSTGTGGSWDSSYIKDPWVIWDGSQYVMHYTGYNGSTFGIGRATSPDRVTWTKYASNPVITPSGTGDETNGCYFPNVLYVPTLSPAWHMWYQGFPAGASPVSPTGIVVRYADSTDGITWTKRGTMLTAGSAGTFSDSGMGPGGAYYDPATGLFHVYPAGYRASTNFFHGGHCTATNPASSGSYSTPAVLTGFDSTLSWGGRTWRSNTVRCVGLANSGYRVWMDGWNPSDGSGAESCAQTTASDFTTIVAPSTQMLSLGSGWDSISAENPIVMARF